jgi:hypothetical protein
MLLLLFRAEEQHGQQHTVTNHCLAPVPRRGFRCLVHHRIWTQLLHATHATAYDPSRKYSNRGIIKGQRRSDGVTVKEKVTGRKWSYWAAAVASKLEMHFTNVKKFCEFFLHVHLNILCARKDVSQKANVVCVVCKKQNVMLKNSLYSNIFFIFFNTRYKKMSVFHENFVQTYSNDMYARNVDPFLKHFKSFSSGTSICT